MVLGIKKKSEEIQEDIERMPIFQAIKAKIRQLPLEEQKKADQALECLVSSLVLCQSEAFGWIATLKGVLEKHKLSTRELTNIAQALFS